MDYLNPTVDHSDWEPFEDEIILKGQKELGNRWKDICKLITHKIRGAAAVKVRWHFLQRKVETNKKRHDDHSQSKMFFIVNPSMTSGAMGGDPSGQQYPMFVGMPSNGSGAAQYANMLGLPEGSIPPGAVVYICPPDANGLPQAPAGGIDFSAIAAAAANSTQQQQQQQMQQQQMQQQLQQQQLHQQQINVNNQTHELTAKAYL
jgi:hypothetical protein